NSCLLRFFVGDSRKFDGSLRLRYSKYAGWSSLVARRAHNPKVVSSNLTPATKLLLYKRVPRTVQPSEFAILVVNGISGLRLLLRVPRGSTWQITSWSFFILSCRSSTIAQLWIS